MAKNFKLFGTLKLIRVIRLNRIIRDMSAPNHIKVTFKLMKVTFFLVLYIHILSCLWYAVAKQDKLWMPPLNIIFDWYSNSIFDESLVYQYWICTYTSCLFLLGNDLWPRGLFLTTIGTILNFLGGLIIALLFGQMAVLVGELS